MKAVIIAGGLGVRLRPLTNKKPKPMLLLDKKPLLEHLIKWIKKNGIRDIVLCVSYLHETIEKYFEDGSKFGVNIEYAISKKPLATAGQLKTAQKFIDDTFVCVYGDTIFDFISGFSFQANTLPLLLVSITPYLMDVLCSQRLIVANDLFFL